MTRIYQQTHLKVGNEINLDADASNYVARVLRSRVGDEIVLFNGTGGEYRCRITNISKSTVSLSVDTFIEKNVESPLNLTLAQGISKGEKMDYTIQKCVELGVNHIVPLAMERSTLKLTEDRKEKRLQHWQGVATSACEQSGRNIVPTVSPLQTMTDWLKTMTYDRHLMFHPKAEMTIRSLKIEPLESIAILIGPEGGFSKNELTMAKHNNFQIVNLGPRILRTETAGLAAISALQTLYGDF